jgi:hypothetical protein
MADVFVFGANECGIHGKGSALAARKSHGAIYGQGEGRQGNSYGIPTKKTPYITLPLDAIQRYVQKFLTYAQDHPEDTFNVVRIGCMNAGYKDHQIAPMFETASSNVNLPDEWKKILSRPTGLTMDDLYNAE